MPVGVQTAALVLRVSIPVHRTLNLRKILTNPAVRGYVPLTMNVLQQTNVIMRSQILIGTVSNAISVAIEM